MSCPIELSQQAMVLAQQAAILVQQAAVLAQQAVVLAQQNQNKKEVVVQEVKEGYDVPVPEYGPEEYCIIRGVFDENDWREHAARKKAEEESFKEKTAIEVADWEEKQKAKKAKKAKKVTPPPIKFEKKKKAKKAKEIKEIKGGLTGPNRSIKEDFDCMTKHYSKVKTDDLESRILKSSVFKERLRRTALFRLKKSKWSSTAKHKNAMVDFDSLTVEEIDKLLKIYQIATEVENYEKSHSLFKNKVGDIIGKAGADNINWKAQGDVGMMTHRTYHQLFKIQKKKN